MAGSLHELFDTDLEAYDFFQSLPMFIQDQVLEHASEIQTREELSGVANNILRDGLMLDQYETMFEDETDSAIDFM